MTEHTHTAFVGTYTEGESEGIYRLGVDVETGELDELGATDAGENPSFLDFHPNGEYLYAVNEGDDGAITAFEVDSTEGTLERLNNVSVHGAAPCYCRVEATGEYVLTANYMGGNVTMVPIDDDGSVGDPTHVVDHEGSSVNPDRQTEPHPHSINPGPENRFAYVPDLGTDEIRIYGMDLEAGKLRPAEADPVAVHDGAGPRHLAFHPDDDVVYLINELDSTIVAYEVDPETGGLEAFETVRTVPENYEGENYTADIHVHPSGDWLYGSNRGHHSIVVCELDPDSRHPTPIDHESTRGEWPRNFAIDPAGEHLYAENRHTDDIVVFDIDGEDGTLDPTGEVREVPEPVCMKLLERP